MASGERHVEVPFAIVRERQEEEDGRPVVRHGVIDLVYRDRTGEVFAAAYNPDHHWCYYPQMQKHEVVLLKCYDSAHDGRARFTVHSAFEDPGTPPDAPARESIEVRTLAFFD